jgi:acetyl coenzyme A synthetase (ADP forming)-like protein
MLKGFFSPRGIAVIGASHDPSKIGHVIVRNILQAGFAGSVYPVNPKGGDIEGRGAVPSVADLPEDCELAVFAVPPARVLSEMTAIGKRGIRNALIITAGFKEVGPEGERLERQLLEISLDYGISVIGPNCFGVIDTRSRLNTTFLDKVPSTGRIAFISQSGAVCVAILDWSLKNGVGFSKFVSMGNKLDVDEAKLIEYLASDPDTDVIVGYLESVKNGAAFIEASRRSSDKKPIVLFKAGTTALGAKAASSHTGALAGSDAAFAAACRQTGIIRSPHMEQLFDFALCFASGRPLRGNRVVVVTNAGGPAVIATDSIETSSLRMAAIGEPTKERLRTILPPTANVNNPVDIIGDATSERYADAFAVVKDDRDIDGFIVILTPTEMLVPEKVAGYIQDFATAESRPVISVLLGGQSIEKAQGILTRSNLGVLSSPERAVDALDALNHRRLWLEEDKTPFLPDVPNRSKAEKLIEFALAAGMSHLTEQEARGILGAYGIRLVRSILAQKPGDAVLIAENLGYPVVMKIVSRDVIHKSDAGGVKVGLESAAEVFSGFEAMMRSVREKVPQARIDGVIIQPMLKGGKEVIVGASRDPQFGPLVMAGLGGIYVETIKDVAFRLAPMSKYDAASMIEDLRSVAILKGVRGEKPSDIEAIQDVILRVARLMVDFPAIRELDVNPLKVFEAGSGAVALDARIALGR